MFSIQQKSFWHQVQLRSELSWSTTKPPGDKWLAGDFCSCAECGEVCSGQRLQSHSLTLSLSLTFCYHAAIWQEPKWILAEWKMNGLLIGSRSVLNDGCGTSPYIHSRAGRHSGFYTPHKSHVTVLNRSELWPHLQLAVGGRFSFHFHF